VSVESFLKLKEIQSLTQMRINHLSSIKEQEDRLYKLNHRRQEALTQTLILKQDLLRIKDEFAEIDKKILDLSEQKQRLIDYGGDEKKVNLFSLQIQEAEDTGLQLLDSAQEINTEIEEVMTFLQGLDKTIVEITSEVSQSIEAHQTDIGNINFRTELLMAELPDDFRSMIVKIASKNLIHGPFTRVDSGYCHFCRFKISRQEESEIDMQKSLKTCNQCGRIFLPYGAS
jgi:predicted  nucleic acid-binding Zn-ribbon protein